MSNPIAKTEVPIRALDELMPLGEFVDHPLNPLGPSATRYLVRKSANRPEFRRALVRVGRQDLVHIPSWLKAFEAYRVDDDAA